MLVGGKSDCLRSTLLALESVATAEAFADLVSTRIGLTLGVGRV